MVRIDPADFLHGFDRLDVEVDHDRLLIRTHEDAFRRFVGLILHSPAKLCCAGRVMAEVSLFPDGLALSKLGCDNCSILS